MGNKKNRAKANGGSDLFALRLRLCRCISQPTQQRLRFFRYRKNSSVLSNINTGSLLSESSKIVKMRNRENRAKPNGGLDRHYGSHSGTALHHHSATKNFWKIKTQHFCSHLQCRRSPPGYGTLVWFICCQLGMGQTAFPLALTFPIKLW